MSKTKRNILIAAVAIAVIAVIVGVSFAAWSNFSAEKVFTLKAGELELNISSDELTSSGNKLTFANPRLATVVTLSFSLRVDGLKSTVRFAITDLEYNGGDNGEYIPAPSYMLDIQKPKTVYGIGGDGADSFDTAQCKTIVSFSNALNSENFDEHFMGKNFRFNINVKAENYTAPDKYGSVTYDLDGGRFNEEQISLITNNNTLTEWCVETDYELLAPELDGWIFDGWYKDPQFKHELTGIEQDQTVIEDIVLYAKWSPKYTNNISYECLIDGVDIGNYNDTNATQYMSDGIVSLNALDLTGIGYNFLGWYDNEDFIGEAITEFRSFTGGDKQFYARVEAIVYDITYEYDNPGHDGVYTVPELDGAINHYTVEDIIDFNGSSINVPGYTVSAADKWTIGDVPAHIEKGTMGNITVRVPVTADTHTITFNIDESIEGTRSITLTTNDTVDLMRDYPASRNDADFYGWFKEATLQNPVNVINPGDIVNDITVYPQWRYEISFNDPEGVYDGGILESIGGATVTLPYGLTKDGMIFDGWTISDDKTFTSYAPSAHTVFTAKWSLITYNITYELNNSNVDISGIVNDNPLTFTVKSDDIILKDVSVAGYTFNGWKNADGETVTQINKGSFGDITLIGQISPDEYVITLNLEGGSLENSITEIIYTIENGSINLNDYTPVKANAVFKGWYLDGGFTNLITEPIILDAENLSNFAVFARWEYAVTYNMGTGFDTVANGNAASFLSGETLTLQAVSADNWTFVGWYDDNTFSSEITELNSGTVKEVYALWSADITFTDSLGGNSAALTVKHNETYDITAPADIPQGYTFDGWYTAAVGGDKAEIANGITPIGNTSYFAVWNAIERAVTLDANGGIIDANNTKTVTVTIEDTLDLSSYTAEMEGATFEGWYTEQSCLNKIESVSGLLADVTYYAGWSYAVTYDGVEASEHTNPVKVMKGGMLTLTEPVRDGFTFDGWYADNGYETKIDAPFAVTSNTTVYAKWTENVIA